jgi:hypothetical protein
VKILKIGQYIISIIHLALQIFYYFVWNNRIVSLADQAKKIDSTLLSNLNFTLSQESFIFLSLSIITLVFYLTIAHLFSLWMMDQLQAGEKKENA